MAGYMQRPRRLQVPTQAGMVQASATTEESTVELDYTTETISIIADAPVKVGFNVEAIPSDYVLLLTNERLTLDLACTTIVLQAVSAAANVKITYTYL